MQASQHFSLIGFTIQRVLASRTTLSNSAFSNQLLQRLSLQLCTKRAQTAGAVMKIAVALDVTDCDLYFMRPYSWTEAARTSAVPLLS